MRQITRIIGGLVLAVAAVIVFFAMKPEPLTDRVDSILSEGRINNASAQGAPQQAVVNGWTARDLLAEIAQRPDDERPAALMLIAVLGIALALVTSEPRSQRQSAAPSTSGSGGPPMSGVVLDGTSQAGLHASPIGHGEQHSGEPSTGPLRATPSAPPGPGSG